MWAARQRVGRRACRAVEGKSLHDQRRSFGARTGPQISGRQDDPAERFAALCVFVRRSGVREWERAIDLHLEFAACDALQHVADHGMEAGVLRQDRPPRKTPCSALLRAQRDRASIAEPARAATPTPTSRPRYASTPMLSMRFWPPIESMTTSTPRESVSWLVRSTKLSVA